MNTAEALKALNEENTEIQERLPKMEEILKNLNLPGLTPELYDDLNYFECEHLEDGSERWTIPFVAYDVKATTHATWEGNPGDAEDDPSWDAEECNLDPDYEYLDAIEHKYENELDKLPIDKGEYVIEDLTFDDFQDYTVTPVDYTKSKTINKGIGDYEYWGSRERQDIYVTEFEGTAEYTGDVFANLIVLIKG